MNFLKLVLFLFLAKCSNSYCTLLAKKAAYFANSVFKDGLTSVVWWHDNSDNVADFIKLFQRCIVVAPVQESEASNEVIRQFNIEKNILQTVFFAAEIYEVEYFMSLLNRHLIIPIRLVVVLTKPATYTELTDLMEIAWNNDVSDILVVNSQDEKVLLTTYFPYRNGKCDDFTPVRLKHDTRWFPKKFTNFHGCEIRTTLHQMPPFSRLKFKNNTLISISGIDADILNIILDKLNASMKVISARDSGGLGLFLSNGTATGSLADLVNKETDVILPSLFMSRSRYHYLQFTHPHESATIKWFGPPRRRISKWLRVLKPFISHISPALFSTSIAFIIVTMVVRRFELHRSFSRHSVILQTFMIFLGIEVKFENKLLITSNLFALWIWFCMVVRIAFQGDLVNGLQNTAFETPLRTFESSVELVDGYGGNNAIRDFYVGTQYFKKFKDIPIKNITDNVKAIEAGKRFLIATEIKMTLDSAPNIQILGDDSIIEIPVCFYMRPGWPAAANIDDVLKQMIEKGIVAKIDKDHYWEWAKKVDSKDDCGAKPLTLDGMIGCFYGLGIMYGVCILVLFAEILYSA